MQTPCASCGCTAAAPSAHAVRGALLHGDVDQAIEQGLLEIAPCVQCNPECTASLLSARDARLGALAARERYRARMQRLQRRADARDKARAAPVSTKPLDKPALPAGAAAALARARAKAAGRSEG